MSSRALRKAQREREEARLQELEHAEEDGSEEETVAAQPAKRSVFSMLAAEADELDEAEHDSDDDVVEENEAQESTPASIPKQSSNKKKKKKRKGKAISAPNEAPEPDEELDEIDKALRELSTNGDASTTATTVSGTNQEANEMCKLLAIDSSHLHAQNEMRRLFGRAALDDRVDDPPPNAGNIGGNRRQQREVQRIGLAQALRNQGPGGRSSGLSQIALKRNIFVQGKEDWPNATIGGLGMEVEDKRADGTILYRFVHNSAYQEVQSQFEIAVESMDPNRLVVMLQQNPYHISTLLQVSEIAKQDRENAMSGDLLERALFSFGRAVHSTFAKNLAEGKARLDFRRPENRELWLAGWRYMQNLTMRATWRTVYEWAKLLLSLSPEDDPYGTLLIMDQYALRARQDLDYLNLARSPAFKDVLKSMPNSQLSQGLAEFRAGNQGKGKQALYTAAGRYPWVFARLMQENNVNQLPPGIWGKEARTGREKLHSEMYAMRAKDIWNTPEASALLLEVASALPPETPGADVDDSEISRSEARHILLSDIPSLIALVPRTYTAQLDSASDPLPPVDSYASSTPGRSTESSLEAIEHELNSLGKFNPPIHAGDIYMSSKTFANTQISTGQFLSSFFPGRDMESIAEEDVQHVIDAAGPERGARIVDAARRIEALRRRRERLELSSIEEIMRVVGGMSEQQHDPAQNPRQARVEDAPDEDRG